MWLLSEDLNDLGHAGYFYARTACCCAKSLLTCVKLPPVRIRNYVCLAFCKQAVDRSSVRLQRLQQTTSFAVCQHARDSLNRIRFVAANHTTWPALDPTGSVLAGKGLLGLRIEQPPQIVEENPGLFRKRNSGERIAVIAH